MRAAPAPGPLSPRVLVVTGREALGAELGAALAAEGYGVDGPWASPDALARLRAGGPDLVVVDVGPVDRVALDTCREVRRRADVPILAVSSCSSEGEVVACLEAGADDHLAHPERRHELVARVRALLRRRPAPDPGAGGGVLVAGDLVLDPEGHRVRIGERQVSLSLKEFGVLEYLLVNRGRVLSAGQLLSHVWGPRRGTDERTVRVHIGRLRAKIEDDPARPSRVLTVRGVGYRYQA